MASGAGSRSRTQLPEIANEEALDPGVFEGLAGVRLAMRRFLSFSEAVLSEAGVTSQQYQALLVLKVAPQSRIMLRQLAEEMLIQHHGAVQLVDRLVAAGLALRIPAADDKRRVLVTLTEYGERVLNFLAKRHLGAMLDNEPLLIESLSRLRALARTG
ncbi:MarR family transcriptional regulator (plasmid) [Sinorhizobium meliloti]|uniref:MarR family winged helix-turn-helix transcriptional regulator n=1 Tax=Rhizobium meliloti TaxID=382 RepID=UPI002D767B2F|nr:MarR family transcriptional regulator [Sinorhizobium meliloti]WRQ71870.1 MarR family transcriptional regulator [Sinorhizobium meliloti]